ncbi:MAG: cytochrome c-type biogenesis protein CcsB [Lentimonas sp.]|jgi:cytochrome c-type biogenesis protein CcsB
MQIKIMEKITKELFSMRMMSMGLLAFLIAIGSATLIESVHDIQTAKLMIYNALWFEILLIYLGVNLIANIFKHQMYKRKKIATLTFHLSFIVILIGAAITRFVSYEGLMLIREGESSNFIYSSDPYLWMRVNDGEMQYTYQEKTFQSEYAPNEIDFDFDFPGHQQEIEVSFVNFRKNLVDSLVINDSINGEVLDIVTDGMSSNYLSTEGFVMLGDLALSYDKKDAMPGLMVTKENGKYYIKSSIEISFLPMSEMVEARKNGMEVSDSSFTVIPVNQKAIFQTTTLYKVQNQQFVFKGVVRNAKKMLLASSIKNAGADYLTIKITDGKNSRIVDLEGGASAIGAREVFNLGGLTYEMEYGSKRIELPFSIACRDFQLDRYPGSNSPSSFASEVTVVDEANNVTKDRRIFMNEVLDYGGFRFFQSSYDPDEKGTRLSVNHDFWGTNVTYLGYLLMAIGMILSLFAPSGRFRNINDKTKNIRSKKAALSLFFLIPMLSFGQVEEGHEGHNHEAHDHAQHENTQVKAPENQGTKPIGYYVSPEHSKILANMAIQDFKGRIIPFHTFADQLLRKLSRNKEFEGKNAVQTIFSMHMYPAYWMDQNVIYVSSNLYDTLGVRESLCSFNQLSKGDGRFLLEAEYNISFQKPDSKKNEFDKKLIKLGEKFQIAAQIFSWSYMKVIPLPDDKANAWYVPFSTELKQDKNDLSKSFIKYLSAADSSSRINSFIMADALLMDFKLKQREQGKPVIPSETALNTEVSYNKMNIFKNASRSYLTLGFIMLITSFVLIFKDKNDKRERTVNKINKVIRYIMILIAAYHASGLAMRWYITGHAPWSNGYEAVVFISLITMLAGFIFSRKNAMVLAGSAILAFLMIFVTEMNLMDPEITPLQPVLKSYWLMIHVAIITGSYGFLGLSCILGILNLILYIFKTPLNKKKLSLHINELTYVSEMTMTIGLFMLTIGTFLGGIWANESWGRYWGWDPKETWALVSVLVYAVILHLRFIPKLKSKFTFNLVSVWGYSAILFTFFGVNFYLVGLHSYAQGEGLGEIPNGVIVTILMFMAFSILAYVRNRKSKA